MPWLSIIMAIISFLASLKKDKSNVGQAALVGAAAGLGTYYVSHETEWGKTNLGALDGVVVPIVDTNGAVEAPASDDNGGALTTVTNIPGVTGGSVTKDGVTKPGSVIVPVGGGTTSTGSLWTAAKDNLLPIGAGLAAGTALSSGDDSSKWIVWGGAALLLILILK